MRTRNARYSRLKPHHRVTIAILGLVIVAWGALTLIGGQMNYASSWAGLVFAPLALLVGMLVLLMAIKPRNRL
jgi:hypothetical protein